MHQALYRKWRPSTFEEVVGQEHITSVLKYEIEQGSFSHAYLFCGSRGTGKTTCAKILAKAVNCESPVNGSPCGKCRSCRNIESGAATDVLEMDAASNNGVDNIRDIRDEVVYTPSEMKYRVYIVDEVHMLSGSAFNALLKTLEEPPEHVIFILATTELQKLPATIISRCQRFDFRRITIPVLTERLMKISAAEGFNTDEDAARLIAKLAQGGMRDAISLLDLCSGTNKDITVSVVEECSGITGRDTMIKTVRAIAKKDYELLFDTVAEVISSSKDLAVFWQDLISVYRDLLVIKTTANAKKYLDLTEAETEELLSLASLFTKEALISHSKMLDNSYYTMQRGGASKRMIAEMALVRMCDESLDTSSEAILSRVSRLEDQIKLASFGVPIVTEAVEEKKDPKSPEKKKSEDKPSEKKDEAKKPAEIRSNGSKPTLRPLRCKMEVAEKLALTDIPASSFLKSAKVFEDQSGGIIVKLTNDFAVMMLTKPNTKNALLASLSSALGRPIADKDLTVEKILGDEEEKYDILDELIND